MFSILLQFKDVNFAHSILSDEQKKDVYDQWGSRGIALAESMGDEVSSWLLCLCAVGCVVCGGCVVCIVCVVCVVCVVCIGVVGCVVCVMCVYVVLGCTSVVCG